MPLPPDLSPEQREDLIRRCWYSHDARWFRAVAQEFGLEVANRLNRQVIRAQGKVETRRLMKALGISQISDVEEMIRFVDTAVHLIVGPLMEFEIRALNDHSYEGTFHRCFVHENIVKAGVAQSYFCAVFDRLQGFHDAANLPLTEEIAALPCAKAEGQECRRVLTVQPPKAWPPCKRTFQLKEGTMDFAVPEEVDMLKQTLSRFVTEEVIPLER